MLKDSIPFDRLWLETHGSSRTAQTVVSFIRFLERRLGAQFVYDSARIGYASPELTDLFELAEALRKCGVILSYGKKSKLTDEPPIAHWYAICANEERNLTAGSSPDNERLAFTSALAEAIERYVWFESTDQFPTLRSATVGTMAKGGETILPERFVGYSSAQRKGNSRLQWGPESQFTWVKGYSWTKEKSIWMPAQIVSGHKTLRAFSKLSVEPSIRASITTGLATHPKRTHALLGGALEIIERDAYSIMWLNQLSLPRFDLTALALQRESLARLLARCRRYRLEPHAIRLSTDAPTYAVCAVLEDTTGTLPRFSVGLKANRDPALAVERAILEALRAHQGTRVRKLSRDTTWDPHKKANAITQYERLQYWAEEGRADRLAFLIQGDVLPLKKEAWEQDTDEEHLARLIAWCRARGYELASVSFTRAKANIPGWHIEFVVIPELQPLHYFEGLPYVGGTRLEEIPRQFGYMPREPYLDDPHPFA